MKFDAFGTSNTHPHPLSPLLHHRQHRSMQRQPTPASRLSFGADWFNLQD
ncbi:MAG: hypothetical protein HUU38_18760 [Anaerolineales bacterium]|nr:hypothetical protein [Anaerolineales bacterium]